MDEEIPKSSVEPIGRAETDLSRLRDQLQGARREIAQMKWILFSVILLVLSGIAGIVAMRSGVLGPKDLFGPELPKTVESKEFGLYNRDGKRVMIADIDKWGLPNLVFMDLDLNYKMGLKVYNEGGGSPGVVFYDRTGTRASFRMGEEGEARIDLLGANQKGGLAMAVSVDGKPTLKMTDPEGRILFEAPPVTPGESTDESPAIERSEAERPAPNSPR
ncbi:hypothetical protein P12x_001604 [Tundrisphaera lichenicola]|uniref:hypothetical protein n=1 Tax=Tundrisphaera lichenicola TaxID=2029860 RepID=UPI003EBDBF14